MGGNPPCAKARGFFFFSAQSQVVIAVTVGVGENLLVIIVEYLESPCNDAENRLAGGGFPVRVYLCPLQGQTAITRAGVIDRPGTGGQQYRLRGKTQLNGAAGLPVSGIAPRYQLGFPGNLLGKRIHRRLFCLPAQRTVNFGEVLVEVGAEKAVLRFPLM